MQCPHGINHTTKEQKKQTSQGYRIFYCSDCRRTFNERTGTPFNYLEYPTDLFLLVVLYRLRYKLSLRDLAELFLEHSFTFTHEAVRDWEARFALLLADQLRGRRRGQAGSRWHIDETYVKVQGKWCYLYRAIDRDGNLVDSMLSQKRNMNAAQRFFRQALQTVGHAPERVTTDGHDSSPRAIRETLGSEVIHRCNHYLNNLLDKTTVESSSATTPCVALETLRLHRASVEPSIRCVNSFGSAQRLGNLFLWHSNVICSLSGSMPSRL